MIALPLEKVDTPDIGAIAYLLTSDVDDPELAIDTWDLAGQIPEFYCLEAYEDAIRVTKLLIERIEAQSDYVPEGWEPEDVYYLYCALVDGLAAFEEAYPTLEAVDESSETFEGIIEGMMDDGLLAASDFVVPEEQD